MAGGSWGGGGDTPVHPSAWCKANQGWVSVDAPTSDGNLSLADVKTSPIVCRLWRDGTPGSEYFLLENRQQRSFDVSLPAGGLLIWHIDESQPGNTNENHYKVALMQADGKRDMELNRNRGDGGDPYPGATNNRAFTSTSSPNSKSYANANTCVAVTGISASSPVMTANLQVKCVLKPVKEHKEIEKKDFKEFKEKDKREKEKDFEKPVNDRPGKPVTDKSAGLDKSVDNKPIDQPGPGIGAFSGSRLSQLEARVTALEATLGTAPGGLSSATTGAAQPFIGSELRPDLSQSALSEEEDHYFLQEQMGLGSAQAKRTFDKTSGQ